MQKRCIPALFVLFFAAMAASAQSISTARRRADLQVGVGFTSANSDYEADRYKGLAFYTTLDVRNHLGGEFVFHQVNTPTGDSNYERTYEIGPRYFRTYGRFTPYIKAMYGRGVFNFPNNVANLAYNIFAGGIGTDIRVLQTINVRIDYEYQDWLSFPPNGLSPRLITVGVAYHFPGQLKRGLHF